MNPLGLLALCYSITHHMDPEQAFEAAEARLNAQETAA